MHLRRDHHGLVGRRHRRVVRDLVNGRTGIGGCRLLGVPGVPRLVGTGIAPVASSQLPLKRKQHLRPAVQPARLEPQRRGLPGGQRVGVQGHLARIVTGPYAVAAADVQRMAAL